MLQEKCFENETTNEADGKTEDELLVDVQIKMKRISIEIATRIFM